MTVLGLNAYAHDAGVALVAAGRPVFVLEEERLDRVHKSRAFPARSLALLAERHPDAISDVEAIAVPWRGLRFAWTVAKEILARFPGAFDLLREQASPNMNVPTALRVLRVRRDLVRHWPSKRKVPVTFVGHHDAHAANAFFLSPFDEAAILIMDGFGDECSMSVYEARGTSIRRLRKNRFFDSVGIMYSMLTRYLGFRTIRDEGTVMALAAHGTDALCADLGRMVCLLPQGEYRINERFFGYQRHGELQPVSAEFIGRFGPPRHPGEALEQRHLDVARALQSTLERTILHVVRHLRHETGQRALCLGGGTFLNCLVNQRIVEDTDFDHLYVSPNPNDAGVALGAALAVDIQRTRRRSFVGPACPFAGPAYDPVCIDGALRGTGLVVHSKIDSAAVAARLLADGKIVAWYQGAAEMGPRALGNRSILGDPRDPTLPERLNVNVKRRQAFRPYAPAVLHERAHELFEGIVPASPYMSFAPRIRRTMRSVVPAIVSKDGTARIQTVARDVSPLFHRLIAGFAERTGIPAVLNTSFNCQEPTVCTPEDAVRTFVGSGIDALVMGDRVVMRACSEGKPVAPLQHSRTPRSAHRTS